MDERMRRRESIQEELAAVNQLIEVCSDAELIDLLMLRKELLECKIDTLDAQILREELEEWTTKEHMAHAIQRLLREVGGV